MQKDAQKPFDLNRYMKQKQAKGLRKMLFIYGGIFLVVMGGLFGWLFTELHAEDELHDDLARSGIVTTAKVTNLKLSYYQSGSGRGGRDKATTDEKRADTLRFTATFSAGGKNITTEIATRYGYYKDDHKNVLRDAKQGSLRVRYLVSNPSSVRPEAEFTDSKRNPHGTMW